MSHKIINYCSLVLKSFRIEYFKFLVICRTWSMIQAFVPLHNFEGIESADSAILISDAVFFKNSSISYEFNV